MRVLVSHPVLLNKFFNHVKGVILGFYKLRVWTFAAGPYVRKHRPRKRQCKPIRNIWRSLPMTFHIFFTLVLDFIFSVKSVLGTGELASNVGIIRNSSNRQPLPHTAPHFGTLICILRGIRVNVRTVGLTSKLHFEHWNMKLAASIDNSSTYTSTIDENCVGSKIRVLFRDSRSQLHRVKSSEHKWRVRSCVAPFTKVYDWGIVAKSRDINSDNERIVKVSLHFSQASFVNEFLRNELHRPDSWEHSLNTHSNEIRVIAIVLYPARDLLLIG